MASTVTVLNSWKEIAGYLGRGIRTVQRYEQEFQLPVRRLRGKARGGVIAFPKDLDNWLTQNTANESFVTTVASNRELLALQIHEQAMLNLGNNVKKLMEQVAEGRRIRKRRQWFSNSTPREQRGSKLFP